MNNRHFTCLYFLIVSLYASVVLGQSDNYRVPPGGYYEPVSPLPPHLGESYHHDSTAAGNTLRGWASFIHAQGNWWLSVSQATILFEVAESLDQCNYRQWAAFRAANHKRLEAERQERIGAKRQKNAASRQVKYRTAYRLTSNQLNRSTGEITWPASLLAADFTQQRARLEDLFRQQFGYLDGNNREFEIANQTRLLIRALQRHQKEVPREEYFAAQRFLRGLLLEAEINTQIN